MTRFLIAGGCLALAACASITHHAPQKRGGATQVLLVTSEPDGARVYVGGATAAATITPGKILVRRNQTQLVLRIEKEGYRAEDVRMTRNVSGAVAGNLAFGLFGAVPNGFGDNPLSGGERVAIAMVVPLTGVAIDFFTGAAYSFPSSVHVTLHRSSLP